MADRRNVQNGLKTRGGDHCVATDRGAGIVRHVEEIRSGFGHGGRALHNFIERSRSLGADFHADQKTLVRHERADGVRGRGCRCSNGGQRRGDCSRTRTRCNRPAAQRFGQFADVVRRGAAASADHRRAGVGEFKRKCSKIVR